MARTLLLLQRWWQLSLTDSRIDDREEALMRSVVGGNAVSDGLAVNFLLTAFFIRGK